MSRLWPAGLSVLNPKAGSQTTTQNVSMKDQIQLNVEELEERIAPDSVNGVPGESNGNPNFKGCLDRNP